jgi:DNA-binding beta-propeller fold protein YncE
VVNLFYVGTNINAISVDPINQALYIDAPTLSSILVYNATTYQSVTKIACSCVPLGGTYDSADNELYIADAANNDVKVINASNFTLESLPCGNNPQATMYDPGNNGVYVADSGEGNTTLFNGTTVIGKVKVGYWPNALTLVGSPSPNNVTSSSSTFSSSSVSSQTKDSTMRKTDSTQDTSNSSLATGITFSLSPSEGLTTQTNVTKDETLGINSTLTTGSDNQVTNTSLLPTQLVITAILVIATCIGASMFLLRDKKFLDRST